MSEPNGGTSGFIPKSRLEALTDAVFAFAMTLLVVNIELPQDFHPKTNREFLDGLYGVSDTLTAYLITFFVLVGFWSGRAQETGEPERASPAYTRATLFNLLGVTFLPFSMLAVNRYDLAASVWLYGANMILLAVTALLIARAAERDSLRASLPSAKARGGTVRAPDGNARAPEARIKLGMLIASAILSMIASLYSPDYAMLCYLLVLASPLAARIVERG